MRSPRSSGPSLDRGGAPGCSRSGRRCRRPFRSRVSYGVEREPLEARLAQIDRELAGDVTADRVPQHPIRSVPMDLITAAVVRRILKLPQEFPVLSIKSAAEQRADR
jgi:hypothetical protein